MLKKGEFSLLFYSVIENAQLKAPSQRRVEDKTRNKKT